MSKISDAIKKAREIHFLAELDFDGLIKRYSHQNIIVPHPGENMPDKNNLKGYWALDDGSGTVAVDGSGNGNNGTLVNMEEADWVDGVVGKCLSFNGVDEYVDCGTDTSFQVNIGSFSVWFKAGAIHQQNERIIEVGEPANRISLFICSSHMLHLFGVGGGSGILDLESVNTLNDSIWHHVVATWGSSGAKLYIDAIEVDSNANNHTLNLPVNSLCYIGEYLPGGNHYFNGLIDEPRIYNTALTASEIKALYLSPGGMAGFSRLFEGRILNDLSIGSSFDIQNMKYSTQNVSIRLANDIRLQDEEKRRRLDGGTGRIYIWCEGLDWTDIEYDGLIFQGTFAKNQHDNLQYSFTLKEESKSKFKTLPGVTINESTWPNMRTAGGGGSVAGKSAPLIFGSFAKGIPLFCVDTAAFKYLVCSGAAKSTEAEYNAGTYDVHDKDGGVIAPASYTVYKSVDGEGNLVTYFDFTGDQASLEPLSCSIQGLYDGSGEITGTEDALIEHPADIYYYLLKYHSGIDNIDIKSIRAMRSLLAGLKLSTIINSTVSGDSMVDRISSQCQCAGIVRTGGKIGVMTFDTEGITQKQIKRDIDMIGKSVTIKSTPDEAVVNDLEVHYGYNPLTRKYEGKITKNHINNEACKKSYQQYGARPLKILRLPDIGTEMAAEYIASRYLGIYAFRHDLVLFSVLYHDGFDIQEGDSGLITTIEGPSWDGNGYIDEKAILLDRKFTKNRIAQIWWVIDTG